eukprot:scaffold4376_cov170-Skeletonema_marinoi.AAC.2
MPCFVIIITSSVYLRMGGWDSVTGCVRRWKAWVQNLGWARTGKVPGQLPWGFQLKHKSNLVPTGSIGPPRLH